MSNIYYRPYYIIYMLFLLSGMAVSQKINFIFPEFPYKETSKNELAFQEFDLACQQSPACHPLSGIVRDQCVRHCISPSCYQDVYKFDELEEGEIDVRLNSFKGCFSQRVNRQRP